MRSVSLGGVQAQEFYEHSQRWSNNYTSVEVITIKAQKCMDDQVFIDQDYPFREETHRHWRTQLSVPQVASLVHRYFRATSSPGKSLAEKIQALHFAFCYAQRDIEMRVMSTFRECIENHEHQHGELTIADHATITLIIEKKMPLNGEITKLYKAAKPAATAQGVHYMDTLHQFFTQVNAVRALQSNCAVFGSATDTYCSNPIAGNPYGATGVSTPVTVLPRTPALPPLAPLHVPPPVVHYPCNSCGHTTHALKDCPHMWMSDSNMDHTLRWSDSPMGKFWASQGHLRNSEQTTLPGFHRFRVPVSKQTHFADEGTGDNASNYKAANHPHPTGGDKANKAARAAAFRERNPDGFFNRGARPNYSRGGTPTTTHYERTFVPAILPNPVVNATHVDEIPNVVVAATHLDEIPTIDTTHQVTPVSLPFPVVLQPELGVPTTPPRQEPQQEAQSDETTHTALPIAGTTVPDCVVAATLPSTDLTEYLYLTVYQAERRTLQGYDPTDPLRPTPLSGQRLESRALLDTGSMAGDFVSATLVDNLNALLCVTERT